MKVQQVSAMTNQYQYSLTMFFRCCGNNSHDMLSICFPVITFIAVDVEKKFTMILLVFVDKIAFLA